MFFQLNCFDILDKLQVITNKSIWSNVTESTVCCFRNGWSIALEFPGNPSYKLTYQLQLLIT